MFLQHKKTGHMIDIVQPEQLFDLYQSHIEGIDQVGEEAQDIEQYQKTELQFLSGEDLPECWLNPNYRHKQPKGLLERALHI